MDLVSVIIPCYNVSSFVDNFSWIFEQTYSELEVVLIDDCSTDDTWQKLQAFKQQHVDKNIVLAHNEQNMGLAATRNRGFALSSGKYVCFWDADDQAYPLFVEKMLAKLQQEQADFVCCAYEALDNKGNKECCKLQSQLLDVQGDIDLLRQQAFQFYVVAWNKLVRRDFIQEHNISFPVIRIGEDQGWTLQLVLNAQKIAFIDEPYYQYYTDNVASLSHIYDERRMRCFWEMTLFDLDYIKKFGVYSVLRDHWMISFFKTFLYVHKRMAVDLQKQFVIEMHDFCQQNKIVLDDTEFLVTYRSRVYRFLPKIGFFAKRRNEMKRAYRFGQNLIVFMHEVSALIEEAMAER